MTKFKEYLRAKGVLDCDPYSECDFEINTCAGIETETEIRIMDGCIAVIVYSNIADPEYAVCDRYGEHGWFDTHGDMSCVERFNCDPEYIDWLCHTRCNISTALYPVAVCMYERDEKVRIAFKHMLAGIMSEEALYKYIVRQYPKYIRSV